MALTVFQSSVGGYDDNFSYLVVDTDTKSAFIVDPSGDLGEILGLLDTQSLTLVGVLLTHTHHDHYDQLEVILEEFSVPVYTHELGSKKISTEHAVSLHDGDEVQLGACTLEVLHTPGHIDDAVCYYAASDQTVDGIPKVVTGDTLFVEKCGRTNAEGVHALYDSLQRLMTLPAETEVYPGHDYGSKPVSTIAHEKANNRYILANDYEEFKQLRLSS